MSDEQQAFLGRLPRADFDMVKAIVDEACNTARIMERKGIAATLRAQACDDPQHDDRWCPTCNQRESIADAIGRGDLSVPA